MLAASKTDFSAWTKGIGHARFVNRDSCLLELARGKRVLHMGATDSPFTREAAETGILLHMKLRAVAKEVVGVDTDAEAVGHLRDNYGIVDIVVADACAPLPPAISEKKFDLILCCDVIEHVENPGAMLRTARAIAGAETQIVVTTVNAIGLKPFLRALLLRRESVHPDHVSYYSLCTLGSLLARSGFEVCAWGTFAYGSRYINSLELCRR